MIIFKIWKSKKKKNEVPKSNLQHLAATATAQSCKSTPLPGDLALKNNSVWGVSRRYKFDIL